MKAINRQQQLFRSSPPFQPPFAPPQECGRVCLCVISLFATGEASLLLVPVSTPPECRLHFQCQGAHPALPVCMSARLKSPHRWHCCPASCWANEKPLWQLSWLARLPKHPGCHLSTVWIDHISRYICKCSCSSIWWCTANNYCTVLGISCMHIFMIHNHNCILQARVKLGIILHFWVNSNTPPDIS